MIYDTLQNAGIYKGMSVYLDQAIDFLKTADFTHFPPGRHDISGGQVYLTLQEPALKPFEETAWEAHRKYIDIQIALKDGETIACAPLEQIAGWDAYDESKDALCSHDPAHGIALPMKVGTFAIFFPNDAHRPVIGEGSTQKVVIKVLHR